MIYLDNSATTMPSQGAIAAANKMFTCFGNPSSLHHVGVVAEGAISEARRAVARAIDGREDEIFFTSGGTEANNTALICSARAKRKRGNRIVISAVEHDSVMTTAGFLENEGFEVIRVLPEKDGSISPAVFEEAVNDKTVLVSCMLVNNETGAIFPVSKLRSAVNRKNAPALIHVDAVQALGKMRISVSEIGCDMLTLSAHKIHGIKGSGAIYIKKETQKLMKFYPFLMGGHQEKGFRAGTEAAPAIAAFGAACRELDPIAESERLQSVKRAYLDGLSLMPEVRVNSPEKSAPHILNFSVMGYKSETLLHALEEREIYVSSGSACKKGEISHVLKAQGLSSEITDSAIRISLCRDNTPEEAEIFLSALRDIISKVAHVKL